MFNLVMLGCEWEHPGANAITYVQYIHYRVSRFVNIMASEHL